MLRHQEIEEMVELVGDGVLEAAEVTEDLDPVVVVHLPVMVVLQEQAHPRLQ
jgi:hypothetical protein